MKSHEIARRWTAYFEQRGHLAVPSASLVSPDPSLLFTVAGMVPFIPYFLGEQTPPAPRAVSVQKCIRTADIEEVGKTVRHGTFFQMCGNFSFGDYFKEKAIPLAWELLTTPVADGGFGLDPDRLWVTVYEEDDEAARIWREDVGVPAERIQRMGTADNYWNTGQPGPGGPCSEIFYDRGPEYGAEGGPAADDTRYIEIWNLVFMQYRLSQVRSKDDFDVAGELQNKNIDTGLGLERLAMILQGVENMYETDQVRPVLDRAAELAGREYSSTEDPSDPHYEDDVRLRMVADHVRSALMLIGDGVTPGNEGRGYVLRRLIRRVVRALRLMGVTEPVFPELLPVSRDAMSGAYPVVAEEFDRISRIAYAEEKAFLRTIAAGTARLDSALAQARDAGAGVAGADAFELHDTYGFPIELTLEIAEEAGVAVDQEGFRALMAEQRDRARADAKAKKSGHGDTAVYQRLRAEGQTHFTGYTEHTTESVVRGLLAGGEEVVSAGAGQEVELILDATPFYAESGGQAADTGLITGDGFTLEVLDVQAPVKGLSVHRVRVAEGEVPVGADAVGRIDLQRRLDGEKAHSGTHLVHAALHQVLGPEATQSGSFNKEGYLRFDFRWAEAVSAMARSEIEDVVNIAIRDDHQVLTQEMSLDEARRMGAMSLFGEKYGDRVRVVEIDGAWSRELCGGTHVGRTAQIGSLTLLGEQSVGSGNRRVEALVGLDSFRHLAAERSLVSDLSEMFKAPADQLKDRIAATMDRLKAAEKQVAELQAKALQAQAGQLAAQARPETTTSGTSVSVLTHHVGEVAGDQLRSLVLDLRARLENAAGNAAGTAVLVALTGEAKGRPLVVVATNEAARAAGLKAGAMVKTATGVLGGGGGGKDDVAQGGGQDASAVPQALDAVRAAVRDA
ncbi:alanine--tRNA ligase [Micrococcus flavus]|uniref:Alanine--tRNA ligase n=1 Tax=Micrococcus flavus TaxID=384602 RepID=A0A4Y8X2X5_9MICC|nr:alanine--tRNA ligase [Micrococcus flavus]MBB4882572.1 alanyl-tRNA synthetase [Micrococcus flavus]TFI02151.1 alanine--tRNA ligase [Micrococcus flavus]